MSFDSNKPPLGVKPRWIADYHRLQEVHAAVGRYLEQREPIPQEWLDEIQELAAKLREHKENRLTADMTPPSGGSGVVTASDFLTNRISIPSEEYERLREKSVEFDRRWLHESEAGQ